MLLFKLYAVNLVEYNNKKPKKLTLLGLAYWFASLGNYVCMIPELAACQAPGIIIRETLRVKLRCPFQFGTIYSYLVYVIVLRMAILYSTRFFLSNRGEIPGEVKSASCQVEGCFSYRL
jgi:hypothetical protein